MGRILLPLGLPLLLSGCPLSDEYFVEIDTAGDDALNGDGKTTSAVPTGSTADAGSGGALGGSGGSGGAEASGGSGGSGGADASGGSGGSGGVDASGGSGGAPDATGGVGGLMGSGGVGGDTAVSTGGGSGGTDSCQPSEELCDGVDNDCNDVIDDGACAADCAGFVLDGVSYMYCGNATSGLQIEAVCDSQGMLPVRIDTAEENAALVQAVQPLDAELGEPNGEQRAFWTGASDMANEGTWLWRGDGTVFWIGDQNGMPADGAYSNWAVGRPNNLDSRGEDCAVLYLQGGEDGGVEEWNDLACAEEYAVVCELE